MSLFGKSRDEKNAENDESYAKGVEFGQIAGIVERVIHTVLDNTVGVMQTNRGLEKDEIFNKGIAYGIEHPKRDE